MKMSVEQKLKAVIDTKLVLLPWFVMHAGVITVHVGKLDKAETYRVLHMTGAKQCD